MAWPKLTKERQNWVKRIFRSVRKSDVCPWNGAQVCDSCGRNWGQKCPLTPYGVYDQGCFDRMKLSEATT